MSSKTLAQFVDVFYNNALNLSVPFLYLFVSSSRKNGPSIKIITTAAGVIGLIVATLSIASYLIYKLPHLPEVGSKIGINYIVVISSFHKPWFYFELVGYSFVQTHAMRHVYLSILHTVDNESRTLNSRYTIYIWKNIATAKTATVWR